MSLGEMSQPPNALLLSVNEAARLLSLSRSSLYELIRSGQIQSLKRGSRRLIPMESLEAWIAQELEGATL